MNNLTRSNIKKMKHWKTLFVVLGVLLMSLGVQAGVADFDGTTGDGTSWHDPGNWSGTPTGTTGLPGGTHSPTL